MTVKPLARRSHALQRNVSMLIHRLLLLFAFPFVVITVNAEEPINIGSRLELFVDKFLIEQLDGDARLHLHRPVLCDVALTTDEP